MTVTSFFHVEGDRVVIMTRYAGDGVLGDSRDVIGPDDQIDQPGLSYAALRAAGAGTIEPDDAGGYRIVPTETPNPGR
ncbi:hypothetical protein RA307_30445 [Xanthobacteraceae bacterium Astr-EGSB]|uniref:hypothetical protein n=1 Tax=Astrobacterium formosum TaxID=3069710 RepID=UPI0027AF9F98|nr:hypothetical protein [Xanthobacteraceae bacterium Astr-EGSB]